MLCTKLEVGDKVLLKCTAFKGKQKIQDQWENIIYEVIEQPLGKLPVFKIQSMEGDDMKAVYRNLLLPLFSDPMDQTSEQDSESLVDPKETIGTQVAIEESAIASHLHNLVKGTGNKPVPKGTRVCYTSVSETLKSLRSDQKLDLELYNDA